MANDFIVFTPEENAILLRLLERVKKLPENNTQRTVGAYSVFNPPPPTTVDCQDIYVALTPSSGIGGRSGNTPIPKADCTVYQNVVNETTGVATLQALTDPYNPTVYNLGGAIPGNTYIQVIMDTYGTYWAVMSGDIVVGKCATDIPALSGDTPGKGTVTIWTPPTAGGDGAWITSSSTFFGYNFSAQAMKANKFLFFARSGGYLLGIFESCS